MNKTHEDQVCYTNQPHMDKNKPMNTKDHIIFHHIKHIKSQKTTIIGITAIRLFTLYLSIINSRGSFFIIITYKFLNSNKV